jgi:hypothetical protein
MQKQSVLVTQQGHADELIQQDRQQIMFLADYLMRRRVRAGWKFDFQRLLQACVTAAVSALH